MGSKYEEYIRQYCRTGRCAPEEAREHAVCRAVEEYYRDEGREAPALRHEFVCGSES